MEARVEERRREAELTGNRAIPRVEVVVGRRIHAREHPAIRGTRIKRKHVIEFDLNLAYGGKRSAAREQPGEGGAVDDGGGGCHEIVRGLRLKLAGARGARECRNQSVRIAGAEGERIRRRGRHCDDASKQESGS